MVQITDFSAALVDLTNPQAREWIKDVIKAELIGSGASGWMADFGEGLPYDAVLFSGADPRSYHNRYAEEWAEVNREAIREAGREGRGRLLQPLRVHQEPRSTAPCSGSGTSS